MSFIPAFEIGIWNAWIFMIWLLIQNFAVRLVNKELYQKAGQPSDMKPGNAYGVVSHISMTLWLLATVYSIFLPFQLGTLWFFIGLPIFLSGLIINIVASVNFAATPVNEPVTGGMYRYSRHPIYVAILLIYFSVGIATASWIFLLVSTLWLLLLRFVVAGEELYCLEKYGDSYREYMNKTPRWIGIPKSGQSD